MSKIEKLSIQGIRSFGVGSGRETMQFFTPLTLIVGYNGSGKTTIIECLKYATTGELPPNSKGGAFIHDPKLVGEKEVLGQVKLAFTGTTGAKYVATRSVQLTVKKTARNMKTLDCTLKCDNNGERITISSRVAEMDSIIPQAMGVSTAVLDYVIFCHQDESLWPLSEPSALKKQFDQIFEAMRYTKAVDNLKVLRKKQGEDYQKLKAVEPQDKRNKELAEENKARSHELSDQIDEGRDQCRAMTSEMNEIQEQIKQKHIEANSFYRIVDELKSKREQLQFRKDAIADLLTTLEELPEDDDQLNDALAQYEERMDRQQEQERQIRAQYTELQGELVNARKEHSAKLAEQGRHESDKDKYERQLESRIELIREAAALHGFRGYDNDIKDKDVKAFNERIQKLHAEKKKDLERIEKENTREVDKATSAIQDLEGRKNTSTNSRVHAKQRMHAIEKRIGVLQGEVSSLDVDESARALLESQFGDIDGRLSRVNEQISTAGHDVMIKEDQNQLYQLEAEGQRLNRELVECTRMASERAQLDYRKKELSDRRRKLDTLTSTWKSKLDTQLDGGWEADTLEGTYQAAIKAQSSKVSSACQKRDVARQKQQKLEYRVKTARDTIQQKNDEINRCQSQVVKVLKTVRGEAAIEDYNEEVKMHEEDVETYSTDISLLGALTDYYEKCKETLEKKNKCRLCERAFDEKQGVAKSRFSDRLVKYLDPDKMQKASEDLAASQGALDTLRKVKPDYMNYERLQAEIPGLASECKALEAELETLERQLEEHDEDVSAEEGKQADIKSLEKTVMNIAQTVKDIKDAELQVERIQSQQSSGTDTRTVEEIQSLQDASNESIRSLTARINKTTTDRQRLRDQLTSLELEKSELKREASNVQNKLERKKDFENQIRTLKEEQVGQREVIQKADEELEAIEPLITEARAVQQDTLQRGRAKEKAVVEERDMVANSIIELRAVENDIQAYLEQGGPANLAANARAIATLEKTISGMDKEISDLTVRANKLKQDLDNGDRKKHNITNNLRYRENLRQVETLRKEAAELEDRNANDDYERLIEEAGQLENRHSRLVAERGHLMGEMKTKDTELARLIEEYKQQYTKAAEKYRQTQIQLETTKAAIDDLGRYHTALDNAIMQYHSLKMAEVNRVAGELWQSTYQGTDIDTIMIRSDSETTSASTTAKRSYNYRVCMVKQDTEMDMRGRCSAGQKVLASIIIRLALAESFGVNCGLIALDEPTTNLDRDNIKSLAESLHAIIKQRQAQSNFQLIVITHDEEFLRHMRCSEFCDSFFRVRRDDKQCSVISKESITTVL